MFLWFYVQLRKLFSCRWQKYWSSKMDYTHRKYLIFNGFDSVSLTRYKKSLELILVYENLLNNPRTTMKSHNCHHSNRQSANEVMIHGRGFELDITLAYLSELVRFFFGFCILHQQLLWVIILTKVFRKEVDSKWLRLQRLRWHFLKIISAK